MAVMTHPGVRKFRQPLRFEDAMCSIIAPSSEGGQIVGAMPSRAKLSGAEECGLSGAEECGWGRCRVSLSEERKQPRDRSGHGAVKNFGAP